MSKKKIETRIQQKHDFEVNWRRATGFEPYEGELIIYEAEVDAQGNELAGIRDENGNLPEGRTEPIAYPRFKVGDGKTNVNDLPFTSEVDLLIKKGEGNGSVVMGNLTTNQAKGEFSHSGGINSNASNNYSFTHGNNLSTSRESQAVLGQYNEENPDALFIVGAGTSDSARANAFTTGKNSSNEYYITVGSTTLTENQLKKILAFIEQSDSLLDSATWGEF